MSSVKKIHFVVPVMAVVLYFLIFFYVKFYHTYENVIVPEVEKMEFKGVIIDHYELKNSHGTTNVLVQFDDTTIVFDIINPRSDTGAWTYIANGDSIIKNRGEFKITIVKKEARRTFDLP